MNGAIDERIRELVDAHRPELERLVDQALERELAQLVERLEARNGVTHEPAQAATARSETATKVCDGCGETKPEAAFEKYRRRCRECRRRDRRTTDHQAPAEPGRPAVITAAELADHARRPGSVDANELEHWLLGEQLAKRTPVGLVPTVRAVDLAEGLDLTPVFGG